MTKTRANPNTSLGILGETVEVGLIILLLAGVSAAIYYNGIPALRDAFAKAGASAPDGYQVSVTLFLVIYFPAFLFFVSAGLLYFVKGLRSLLIPDLPTAGSQPFRDYEEFRRGLQEHALSCYGPLGAFVSSVFGKRTMYLSPLRRKIVRRNGEKLKWRALWILLAVLCILWVNAEVKDSSQPNYGLMIPFLWLIALQIVMGVVDFISCIYLVPAAEPRMKAHEGQEFYKGFGHPTHLFSRLPDLGEQLRLGDQPNRTYVIKGEKASVAVSDVGEFGGTFYIERQPLAIDSGRKESAQVLLVAGWVLRILGCFLFLYLLMPSELRELMTGGPAGNVLLASPVFVLVMFLAAASAWLNGGRYYQQAVDLIGSTQFRSVGILINVTGEMARADVQVGKAQMDSLMSSNVAARSNFTARFWAAELISEARISSEPRELLALSQTEESSRWLDHFKQSIHQLRDERVTPVGIELASEEARQISGANLSLYEARVRMLQGPAASAAPVQPVDPTKELMDDNPLSPPAGGEEGKECPECAEVVRLKARKCRYCGHEFEPA